MAIRLLTLKIEESIRDQFNQLAHDNGTTGSAMLKNYIYSQLKQPMPPENPGGRPKGYSPKKARQATELAGMDLSFLD